MGSGIRTSSNPPRRYRPDESDTGPTPLFYQRVRGVPVRGLGSLRDGGRRARALAAFPDLIFQETYEASEVTSDAFVSQEGAVHH